MENTKDLLSTKESAKFLGVDRKTIQNYRKEGILIPDELGKNNSVLYSKKNLVQAAKRLLASGETLLKFNPQVGKRYEQVVKNYSHLLNESEKAAEKPVNVQLVPTKKLTMTNDKLSKTLFAHSPEEYLTILEEGGEIVENELSKLGEIISPYWLELINEYTDKTPLNIFDKTVLTSCTSEWIAGNRYTTPSIIYRHITGKENSNTQPSVAMKELILSAVRKMMSTQITVDMTEVCTRFKYNGGIPLKITRTILPCQYVSGIVINGHELDTVIQFYDESPLLTIARAKNNQLLTFEQGLLDVPNQYNSETNISVRHYVLQRVLEIKMHSLASVITFEDVFKKCNLLKASTLKKSRTRRFVIDIMKTLKTGNDIKDFTVKKIGNEQIAVKFSF